MEKIEVEMLALILMGGFKESPVNGFVLSATEKRQLEKFKKRKGNENSQPGYLMLPGLNRLIIALSMIGGLRGHMISLDTLYGISVV